MPFYEYRCPACGEISTLLRSVSDIPASNPCEHCAGTATRILSRPAVHRTARSKVERLDPKRAVAFTCA